MLGTSTRRLALIASLPLLLAACGDAGGSEAGPGGAAPDGSTSPPPSGPPCPETLAYDEGGGAEREEPAAEAPQLPEATRAWRCEYVVADSGSAESGGSQRWERAGRAAEVPDADLGRVAETLDDLEPGAADPICTMDLGPRWMVVLEHDAGRIGVVADTFGCREVRLTDDPATVVPGESTSDGVPGGVLSGPEDLLEVVSDGRAGS